MIRSKISPAPFLVKVVAKIDWHSTPDASSFKYRLESANVFPVPADARMTSLGNSPANSRSMVSPTTASPQQHSQRPARWLFQIQNPDKYRKNPRSTSAAFHSFYNHPT